jgi:hypothetical protein
MKQMNTSKTAKQEKEENSTSKTVKLNTYMATEEDKPKTYLRQ